MENLIHILPNLITNEDSSWLRKVIKNPDVLTQEIMKHFNGQIYNLSILKRKDYNRQMDLFNGAVNDSTSFEDFQKAIENIPVATSYSYLLEEFASRFDCNGKSISSIVWGTALLNNLEDKGVDTEVISRIFYAVANTMLRSNKNVKDLRNELLGVVSSDAKFLDSVNTSVAYSLLLSSTVQDLDSWFDFSSLEQLETYPMVEITSQEDLIECLRDYKSYNAAIEYIKDHYLHTEPGTDGYCENDVDRTYKAFIIAATLASETYKHNAEFDKDGTIGFNMTADILYLRAAIDKEHILSGVSNKLNGLEDAAGRIVCSILGRDIFGDRGIEIKPRFILPKEPFKTGSVEDYIRNNLSSFEKLIAPNKSYCEDLLTALERIEAKYAKVKVYRKSEKTNDSLTFIAGELGVTLPKGFETKDEVMENVSFLQQAALDRYDELNRMITIYKRIRTHQKDNLEIDDLEFDKEVLKRDATVKADLHEDAIKEFYRAVADDPILKGDKKDKLRIKTPKMILSEIKKRVAKNADQYPELSRLLGRFTLTRQEMLEEIVDGYYVNQDGSTNEEFKEVYEVVKDPKTSPDLKFDTAVASKISKEDKEKIVDLL